MVKEVNDKLYYYWNDFYNDASNIASIINVNYFDIKFNNIYPIPKGGIALGLALAQMTHLALISSKTSITEKTLIVDDIIDSGKTRGRFKNNCFVCLHTKIPINQPNTFALNRTNKWVHYPWESEEELHGPTDAVIRLIEHIKDNPNREGLLETPARVIKAYKEIFSGYDQNPKEIIKTFSSKNDEMVVIKDIEFYSMCEHHMLPFFGKCHIGYVPNGKVVGLSKLPRAIDVFAKRLQIQENLTYQIMDFLNNTLSPKGIAVIMEAEHLCTKMRGVKKQNSKMVTSAMDGVFKPMTQAPSTKNAAIQLNAINARQEFMRLIK